MKYISERNEMMRVVLSFYLYSWKYDEIYDTMDIVELLGVKYSTAKYILNRLVYKGILGRITFYNHNYFFKPTFNEIVKEMCRYG